MGRDRSELRKKLEAFFRYDECLKQYECVLCFPDSKPLPGINARNFLSNTTDHLRRSHSKEFAAIQQQTPCSSGPAVHENLSEVKSREDLALAFARTSLPESIFQSQRNLEFFEALRRVTSIPDSKTMESDLMKLAFCKLSNLTLVEYYSVHLDYWDIRKDLIALVIYISWIDENWRQNTQILHFKTFNQQSDAVTTNQLMGFMHNELLLQPFNCVAWQMNNCNVMIDSIRVFKSMNFQTFEEIYAMDCLEECVAHPMTRSPNLELERFEGIGAHGLNNLILDCIMLLPFFVQLNCFCTNNDGPRLTNTRWYGHLRQLEYAEANLYFLESERTKQPQVYDRLDSLAIREMKNFFEKIMLLGQFFDSDLPVADFVIPQVRKILQFLKKLSNCAEIHDLVRLFSSKLFVDMEADKRFQVFSTPQIAAAVINPSRRARGLLDYEELLIGKQFIISLKRLIKVEDITTPINLVKVESPDSNDFQYASTIDNIFAGLDFDKPKSAGFVNTERKSLEDELEKFLSDVDIFDTAYNFFRNSNRFPLLSQIARVLLSIMPSPTNAEIAFSKATFFTMTKNSKLSNIETRLILS